MGSSTLLFHGGDGAWSLAASILSWTLFRSFGRTPRWLLPWNSKYFVLPDCLRWSSTDWGRSFESVGLGRFFRVSRSCGSFSQPTLLCRHPTFMVSWATIVEAGGIAASIAMKPTIFYIMDVARGYPLYPNETENLFSTSLPSGSVLSLGWTAASVLVVAAMVYEDGGFKSLNPVEAFRQMYSHASLSEPKPAKEGKIQPPYAVKDASVNLDSFNMFDPADLPPRLAEYANMVYSACEDIGNFFGFQDSSVRNQAEHLLILISNNRRYMSSHILPPSVQPPSPIHALHAKVFSNYVKWCRAMGVPPQFSKMNSSISAPPAVASRVVDLVLYFCIWGEGCNLRHMPECTWFLYHKMMAEYIKSEGYTQTRSLYAGHFLDNVVEPIYAIVSKVISSPLGSSL